MAWNAEPRVRDPSRERGRNLRRSLVLMSSCAFLSALAATCRAADSAPVDASSTEAETHAARLRKLSLEELIKVSVSPFQVSTQKDQGYRASNSISGSRLDTPILDLPFAIQAFTHDFIDDQRPVNICDVAKYSPGVTCRSNDFTEGNANLAIRGFAVSATPGNVQILRDGFHGPSIFDFTNIERVEVVKGPASFLYGQLAPGGLVNIITKSPQPEFAATARATYGSYNSYRFDADVTGPLPLAKGFFYRVASSYDRDIRYWDPYDAHSTNISPSLLWRPDDRLSVSVKYENFCKSEDPQVMQKPGYPAPLDGVAAPGLPADWNSMAYTDFRHSSTDGLEASVVFKADEHWDLRFGYGHEKYTVDELETGNFGLAYGSLSQGRRVRGQIYTNDDDTFETEAVGKYQFDGVSLRLLLGGQLVERDFKWWAGQAPNNPAFGSSPASPLPVWNLGDPSTWNRNDGSIPFEGLTAGMDDQITNFEDKAVYGGMTFGFFDDRLLALTGWRETHSESQLTDHLLGMSYPKSVASKVTPQYGVLYKLRPDVSLFASYAESFVPGSQILNVLNVPTRPAVPTEGQGYDVGVKGDLLDGRVSGTLTAFDDRNKNIVNDIAALDPGTGLQVFTNVQSGEQRSRGVEFDATIAPINNWQTYLSYSYMYARIVEYSGNDAAILAQNPATLDAAGLTNYQKVLAFHNAPLQMSAPHLANIWSRYDFTHGRLKGVHAAGGANFVIDQTLLSDTPAAYDQTYTLLNALIGYSWEWEKASMSFELIGKNLSDVEYRPSQSTRSRPREFALSYSVRF